MPYGRVAANAGRSASFWRRPSRLVTREAAVVCEMSAQREMRDRDREMRRAIIFGWMANHDLRLPPLPIRSLRAQVDEAMNREQALSALLAATLFASRLQTAAIELADAADDFENNHIGCGKRNAGQNRLLAAIEAVRAAIQSDQNLEERAADLWRKENPDKSVFACDHEEKERYRARVRTGG